MTFTCSNKDNVSRPSASQVIYEVEKAWPYIVVTGYQCVRKPIVEERTSSITIGSSRFEVIQTEL